jgi:hypothetical protein
MHLVIRPIIDPRSAGFEGFSRRPNNQILITRLDHPELYTLNADDSTAEIQLLHTFAGEANSCVNLCPLLGCDDEYALITATVDLSKVQFSNHIVWRIVLDGDKPPVITKLATLPDAGAAIGIVPFSERTLLIADSHKSCILSLDITTGKSSVLIADDMMRPVKDEFWGINRLRVSGPWVWFTNTSDGTLCRIPIEATNEGEGIRVTGKLEILNDELPHCDGLAISHDQKFAWSACYMNGWLWKVDIENGTTSVVMENLVSPTAVELLYDSKGSPLLYVVCSGMYISYVPHFQ